MKTLVPIRSGRKAEREWRFYDDFHTDIPVAFFRRYKNCCYRMFLLNEKSRQFNGTSCHRKDLIACLEASESLGVTKTPNGVPCFSYKLKI